MTRALAFKIEVVLNKKFLIDAVRGSKYNAIMGIGNFTPPCFQLIKT